MPDWETLPVAEAPLEIIDGDRGVNYPKQKDFSSDGDCLFLNAGNVTTTGFDFTDRSFITRAKDAVLRKGKLKRHDVVLTTRGTVGNVALFDNSVPFDDVRINSGMVLLRADKSKLLPRFLFQFVRSPAFQEQVAFLTTGSAQPQFPIRDIRRVEMPLPPLPEQRAISGVLGALDDKIEQNRRTARALERLARAIFRAWFVDFEPVKWKIAMQQRKDAEAQGRKDQPLHASLASSRPGDFAFIPPGATTFPGMPQPVFDALPTRFTDSPIGPVPEGWEVKALGDLAAQVRVSAKPDEIDPETHYIGLEHMPRRSFALNDWEAVSKVTSNKSRFKEGQILFGKLRPYFHKVGVAPVDGVCSTDIVVVEPKSASLFGPVLGLVTSDAFVDHVTACSSGTKMPRTNWKDMARYEVVIGSGGIASAYTELLKPITDRVIAGIHESRKLAEMRDYLLPKLLCGEVRVEVARG